MSDHTDCRVVVPKGHLKTAQRFVAGARVRAQQLSPVGTAEMFGPVAHLFKGGEVELGLDSCPPCSKNMGHPANHT